MKPIQQKNNPVSLVRKTVIKGKKKFENWRTVSLSGNLLNSLLNNKKKPNLSSIFKWTDITMTRDYEVAM